VNLIPSKQQWRKWSLPSKLGAVGALLGAIGILSGGLFFLIPYLSQSRSDSEGERIEELVSVLEARANRIRNELAPFNNTAEIAEFLNRFNELHQKHIDALRARNFALAHEVLIEIHYREAALHRKLDLLSDREYLKEQSNLYPGPLMRLYVTGDFKTEPKYMAYDKNIKINPIDLYNSILKSGGFSKSLTDK